MEENIFDMSIPQEKFEFATDEKISDQKLDTKPIGLFKDAMIRFRKNKGSVVSFFIILLIVLYAVIVPFTVPSYKAIKSDSYYKYLPPRNVVLKENLGIMGGYKDDEISQATLVLHYAKGVAADGWDGTVETIAESANGYYQPIKTATYSKTQTTGKVVTNLYNVTYDSYLSVGFIFKTVTLEEYDKMKAWEEETGLHLLYPLIDKYTPDGRDAKYNLDNSDANNWFKMRVRGNEIGLPVTTAGGKTKTLEFSGNLVLEDNYYRRGGEVQYRYYNGSAEHETYEVRVLYYNYYRYMNGNNEPNFIFGTDSQGFDFAYRLATGIRLSLILSVCICVVNFILGALYGAVEGYYGGATDMMERITDILVGVPFMVVATLFQMHLAKIVGPFPSLIFAFVLTGWIGTASRVRTQFYRFKNQEYVMAARTLGARDRRVIWKHIFPNTLGTIITSSALAIPSVIFSESYLSFLGIVNLGTTTSTSLGTLLSEASSIWFDHPHLILFPSLFISLLMICFNLFGNGLRDAFNPSLRGQEE